MRAQVARGDRLIRVTTTVCVVVLAGIAAVISYRHMYAQRASRSSQLQVPLAIDRYTPEYFSGV
jgi:hypothetical protein